MPDFSRHTIVWGGGHGLSRAVERGVTPEEVQRIVARSPEQEEAKKGRWIIWGCVRGRRTKVIVKPVANRSVLVVTVVRTRQACT